MKKSKCGFFSLAYPLTTTNCPRTVNLDQRFGHDAKDPSLFQCVVFCVVYSCDEEVPVDYLCFVCDLYKL